MKFEEWLSQQNGVIEVDCGCVTSEAFYHWMRVAYEAGNSPVIPDGSMAMLRRWLAFGRAMQKAGSQLPHNLIAETEALLAAAPQLPGSEPVAAPSKWIPVSERVPESNGVYFGWDGKRVLEVNCFFGGFSANQFIHGEITHWMPLPAPPTEVK